ncbi:hypothetical protein L208DRAFT_1541002 [Tricholoma matsutake]|nr:hypothetical protein L208DRAFT_1541002 [Tricholoma matsutake 945]
MPALPIQQCLLHGAYKYARRLQELCHRWTRSRDSGSDSDSDIDLTLNVNTGATSDDSSISSLSSISSISSVSLANDTDNDIPAETLPSNFNLDTDEEMSSEEEEDVTYFRQLSAVQAHINYLTNKCVLFPNRVHKLSQLYLVLVLFKADDHKQFHQNLRVHPATFDSLLAKIDSHPVFVSDGPQYQMPIDEQLAIALYQFGHYGNGASVEQITQWAGASAGMVVNATRRVITAFLALHDDVI